MSLYMRLCAFLCVCEKSDESQRVCAFACVYYRASVLVLNLCHVLNGVKCLF